MSDSGENYGGSSSDTESIEIHYLGSDSDESYGSDHSGGSHSDLEELGRMIEDGRWSRLKNFLQRMDAKDYISRYNELFVERIGETESALGDACNLNAPLDIIEQIYYSYPEAIIQRGSSGFTPLFTSYYGSSCAVAIFLLDKSPITAQIQDDDGWLPLHQAVDEKRGPVIIRQLLTAHPDAVNARTMDTNETPLDLLCRVWKGDMEAYISHGTEFSDGRDDDGMTTLKETLDLFISFLVLPSPAIESNTDTTYPLHNALLLDEKNYLPPICQEFIVLIHQDEIMKMDTNADYPLHIAISRSSNHKSTWIQSLLRFSPISSKIPSRQGRLPLLLACENDTSYIDIEKIALSYPNALRTIDIKTCLYPFMLSACTSRLIKTTSNDDRSSDSDRDLNSLNKIYGLLRLLPELVQSGILISA